MKSVVDQLATYACYHRDRRNVITHFVGIPMIVIALLTLLSRPEFVLLGLPLTPALLVIIAASIYYIVLDFKLGVLMAVLLALCVWLASTFAAMNTAAWLFVGIGLFVVGWVFQFIGHAFEGRKPAFVDDLIGLAIGPLFVVAEALFLLGFRKHLYREVEEQVAQKLPLMPPVQKGKA